MPTDDLVSALTDLISQHKWVALGAVAIGLVIRLLKEDTAIPISIPPRARIWIVLLGGIIYAEIGRVAGGMPWKQAAAEGLAAALTAVIGHEAVIESARNGKEIPIPGLMKKPQDPTKPIDNSGTPPPSPAPPTA